MNNPENSQLTSLAKNIGIPPQPDLVIKILQQIENDNIDIQNIVNLVFKDVSLSAKVLKVANSPFFRKGKVTSLLHAINLLGIKNFYTVILVASLEEALQVNKEILKDFWSHSRLTSIICSIIAKELNIKEETAYLTGLFHDVGVSIMLNRFDEYNKIQDYSLYLKDIKNLTDCYDTITSYESFLFNTNHCILAYAMAKSWKLSEDLCQVILHHHLKPFVIKNTEIRKLMTILQLAEILSEGFEKGDLIKDDLLLTEHFRHFAEIFSSNETFINKLISQIESILNESSE
ncbi:MAG TPA: HDOD domain-containing protein [Nitrospirae bacterium]|nr:HDOD domain-containing protein [Nitrospirota bacterium]